VARGETAHIYDGLVTPAVYSLTEADFAGYTAGAINAFTLYTGNGAYTGSIDQGSRTITVSIPYGVGLGGLTAAIAYTGIIVSPDPLQGWDYTSPVNYTITQEDGKTVTYKVTVQQVNDGMVYSEAQLRAAVDAINASSAAGDYSITLAGSFNVSTGTSVSFTNTVGTAKNILITGNGTVRTITNNISGDLFTVESGNTLVLGRNVTLDGNNKTGSAVWVNGGKLVIKNGALITKASSSGVVVGSAGTFTMEGGEISGNKANYGGGVLVAGTFTMEGGTISGNTGGGVCVGSGGMFTMTGGTISGNTSSGTAHNGGGVYVSEGTFIMSGTAVISGNTTSEYGTGGGVAVYSGTFTMSGGTISENYTSGYNWSGGGVFVEESTFTMTDGTISGNTGSWGGGVYVSSSGGTFTKSGGTIYGYKADGTQKNTAASGYGHAVYISSGSKERNDTAGPDINLDSSKSGGWGDETAQCTVTFATGMGGGTAPASQTVNAGTSITLPGQESMTAPAYKAFAGWSDGGSTYQAGASYTVTGSVTLTAQWKTAQFTVTFATGMGGGTAPASQTVNAGTSITLPGQESMTAPAYKAFAGWKTGSSTYQAGASYPVTGNVTLTAQWDTAQYIISYLSDASGGANAANPVSLNVPLNLADASSGWTALLGAIQDAGKYVSLDLSACSMSGTEFDPGTAKTGESKIVSLVLPSAATSIKLGYYGSTFKNFTTLKSVSGAAVKTVGNYAFYDCDALTSVSFPVATSIGYYAFRDCDALTSVSFPVATSIGANAFSGTALTTVNLPKATSIGANAFSGTALTTVNLPKATSIGGGAFYNCTALTTVDLPEATSIDESQVGTFSGCTALTTVNLPKVTSIIGGNGGDFSDCIALTTVDLPMVTVIGNNVFHGCTALKKVSLPAATSIGGSAFGLCSSLTTVSLPKATSIGQYAFANCEALTTVELPAVTVIGNNVFHGCTALKKVSLPAATSIGGSAFDNCTALTTLSLLKAASINDLAFAHCVALTEVELPAAESIGAAAFYGCTALITVSLPAAAPTLGAGMFSGINTAQTITVKVPTGATGYGTVPATYNGSDTTYCWGNWFRGMGRGTDNGSVNSYITLNIVNQ
jgi:hypothetical protein